MINIVRLLAVLGGVSLSAAAQVGTIKSVTAPDGETQNSLYVGHYGETIEFPTDWKATPQMNEETEVIYFHRKYKDKWGLHPVHPQESDYRPENFESMGLMMLVVIPKNAPGGLRSLSEISDAKERALKASGFHYEVLDMSGYSYWPQGTRLFQIEKPYRLRQLYSQSPKHFFILTNGGLNRGNDPRRKDPQFVDNSYALSFVERSLAGYLWELSRESQPEDILRYFSLPRLWIVLGVFCGIISILALWPGTSRLVQNMHFFALSMLISTILCGALGFLAAYLPIYFGFRLHNMGLAAVIATLLIPFLAWIAAKISGSRRPNIVFIWEIAMSAPWAVYYSIIAKSPGESPAYETVFFNTVSLLIVGLTAGATFFFAFGPHSEEPHL